MKMKPITSIFPVALLMLSWIPSQAQSVSAPKIGLSAWSAPFEPASPGMVRGLQDFLKTGNGGILLAQAPYLRFISGLNADSAAHRGVVGALGLSADFEAELRTAVDERDKARQVNALMAIQRAVHSQNAEETIKKAVDTRADEISLAFRENRITAEELDAAASELAAFKWSSNKAQAAVEMATRARSMKTAQFAANTAAVLVVEAPTRGEEPVSGALQHARNPHQAAAIQHLLDGRQRISRYLPFVMQIDNEHQAAALGLVAARGRDVAGVIGDIRLIKGPIPVAAVSLMLERGRTLTPSFAAIARFTNEHQLEALRTLLDAPVRYPIADRIQSLLEFGNPFQTEALAFLVSRGRSVRWFLPLLQKVKSPDHTQLIAAVAENTESSRFELGKEKRTVVCAAIIAGGAAALLTLAGLWLAVPFYGLSLAGLWLWGREALRVRSIRGKNRRSLNEYRVEEVFGQIPNAGGI